MKRIIVIVLVAILGRCVAFGVIITLIDAPQDDLNVSGDLDGSKLRVHPELQSLTDDYSKLLHVRVWPLKMKDIDAFFGPKLKGKPDDRVKPLFVPMVIMESGLSPTTGDHRHVDFHAIGDIGYLEVHYGWDGESVATAVIYLRADDKFVPLKSTNDITHREAWDKARFETLKIWFDDHLPKPPNQPPLQTPTSGTPAAGAPVAPPSGAAGR